MIASLPLFVHHQAPSVHYEARSATYLREVEQHLNAEDVGITEHPRRASASPPNAPSLAPPPPPPPPPVLSPEQREYLRQIQQNEGLVQQQRVRVAAQHDGAAQRGGGGGVQNGVQESYVLASPSMSRHKVCVCLRVCVRATGLV